MNKRGINGYVYLLAIIIFLVLVAVAFTTTIPENEGNNNAGWELGENEEFVSESETSADINKRQESRTGNSDISQGSSESGSSENTGQSCETRQISYIIKNDEKTENCLNYDIDNNCIEKRVFCSYEVSSLDIASGEFTVRLIFLQDGGNQETDFFGEQIQSFSLGQGQSQTISNEEIISSTGESGVANQVINCFFNTIGEVTGEVCS